MSHRESGISTLGVLIALSVSLILVAIALQMLGRFSASVEQLEMQEVLDSLRGSLVTEVAEHLMDDRMAELHRLDGTNPIELLAVVPDNYVGERSGGEEVPTEGHWYFDVNSRLLIYRVDHQDYFFSDGLDNSQASYRLTLTFDDKDNNARFDPKLDAAQGLELVPTHNYGWVH